MATKKAKISQEISKTPELDNILISLKARAYDLFLMKKKIEMELQKIERQIFDLNNQINSQKLKGGSKK